jgi:Mg2+/citrate symporter
MDFFIALSAIALHVVAIVAFALWLNISARKRREQMTPEERKVDDRETATSAQEW